MSAVASTSSPLTSPLPPPITTPLPTTPGEHRELASFSAVDYGVFGLMLAVSLAIGAYYALRGHRNTEEFLMAGRCVGTCAYGIH